MALWWKYPFPCLGRHRKAISGSAVNQGLRRLGYTTNEMRRSTRGDDPPCFKPTVENTIRVGLLSLTIA